MALSYVDFIAKNVEICVKFYEDKHAHWCTGKVVKVLDRYLDDNFNECVKCVVKYDDEKYTDIFCESDYNIDDDNGWRFGEQFVELIERVKTIIDDFDETEEETTDEDQESDTETASLVESVNYIDTSEATTSSTTSSDNETDTETETVQTREEVVQAKENKRHSLMNNVGATLFMLAPWIASGVALFNARREIFEVLKNL